MRYNPPKRQLGRIVACMPISPQKGIKSPFSRPLFVLALAGIWRLVVRKEAIEKEKLPPQPPLRPGSARPDPLFLLLSLSRALSLTLTRSLLLSLTLFLWLWFALSASRPRSLSLSLTLSHSRTLTLSRACSLSLPLARSLSLARALSLGRPVTYRSPFFLWRSPCSHRGFSRGR